eukprot:gene9699-biopygen1702
MRRRRRRGRKKKNDQNGAAGAGKLKMAPQAPGNGENYISSPVLKDSQDFSKEFPSPGCWAAARRPARAVRGALGPAATPVVGRVRPSTWCYLLWAVQLLPFPAVGSFHWAKGGLAAHYVAARARRARTLFRYVGRSSGTFML